MFSRLNKILDAFGSEKEIYDFKKFIDEKLKNIYDQVTTNGGTSLRDSVDRMEIRLNIMDERFKAMSEANIMGLYECDTDGHCTWVSHAWSELTGLSVEEAKGNGWVKGVDEGDRISVANEWNECIKDQRSFHAIFNMINRTGTKTLVKSAARPVYYKNKLVGFIGVIKQL